MLKLAKNQKGFSLVELLLGMAIFSFGLLVVTYGIISLIKIYSNGVADRATQNAARVAMDRVVQVGRQGTSYAYGTNAVCVYGPNQVFYINSNTLYQSTWDTTSGTCSAGTAINTPAPLTPGNVQVNAITAEQTDNYSGTTAQSCLPFAATPTPCKGLRVSLQVVTNTASLDANGNCLPTVAICSSTTLSTSLTAGVL